MAEGTPASAPQAKKNVVPDEVPTFATTEARVAFTKNLTLKTLKKGSGDDGRSGAVAGAIAVSYDPDLDGQRKDDVQNSNLYAQLAANAKYDPISQYLNWYGEWRNTMSALGWSTPAFKFVDVPEASYDKTILATLLEQEESELSADDHETLVALAKSLNSMKNGPSKTILNDSSLNGRSERFQLGLVTESGDNAKMVCMSFKVTLKSNITDVFNMPMKSGSVVQFKECTNTMVLNEDTYSTVRDDVAEKLLGFTQEIRGLY